MGSAFDALNAPSSLTARRSATSLLPNFELPPPSNLQFSQRFPPLSTINVPQQVTGNGNAGNMLTPPSNSASDASSTSSGLPSGNTPNPQAMPVLPYTPYWQNTTPNGYHTGFTPQPWQGSNALFPPRGMFSPSLNSIMRNNSNSPTTGESPSLPPPPYDLTSLPPFQNALSVSTSGPMQPQQQQALANTLMQGSGRQPNQGSPVTTGDGLQRGPPTPTMYNGSQHSNCNQQSNYSYSGPSPVQQSPHSATVPVSRTSPPLSQNGLPQMQQNHFIRPPPPSYSLPAMPGAVMQNVSNPGGPMSMVGSMQQSMLPLGFNSGYAANPTHMYPNQRAHSPQQTSNDRPFKCDQCPQSFNRNHDLKRHKRIHLAVKPFPCGHCDKSFSRKDALKRHILVKGCGNKGSTDGVHNDDGTVKSESGSDAASDSPAINAHSHM